MLPPATLAEAMPKKGGAKRKGGGFLGRRRSLSLLEQ